MAIAAQLIVAGTVGASSIGTAVPPGTFEDMLRRPAWQKDGLCEEPGYRSMSWFPEPGGDVYGPERLVAAG